MDEIFGTAYGDLVTVELRGYQRERGVKIGRPELGEGDDLAKGESDARARYNGADMGVMVGRHSSDV